MRSASQSHRNETWSQMLGQLEVTRAQAKSPESPDLLRPCVGLGFIGFKGVHRVYRVCRVDRVERV